MLRLRVSLGPPIFRNDMRATLKLGGGGLKLHQMVRSVTFSPLKNAWLEGDPA